MRAIGMLSQRLGVFFSILCPGDCSLEHQLRSSGCRENVAIMQFKLLVISFGVDT